MIKGKFTREDVHQIEHAILRHRREFAGKLVSAHQFKAAFEVYLSAILFRELKEVGQDTYPAVVDGHLILGKGAYAIPRQRTPDKALKYELQLSTNGWEVAVIVLPNSRASNNRTQRAPR